MPSVIVFTRTGDKICLTRDRIGHVGLLARRHYKMTDLWLTRTKCPGLVCVDSVIHSVTSTALVLQMPIWHNRKNSVPNMVLAEKCLSAMSRKNGIERSIVDPLRTVLVRTVLNLAMNNTENTGTPEHASRKFLITPTYPEDGRVLMPNNDL